MFITLEGSEGAGKSSLIELLKKYFLSKNINFIFTKEPGGTKEGQVLREILLNNSINLDPLSETFLLLADRLEHVRKIINPALENNKNILSDRYLDSTYAYQGSGRGIDKKELDILIRPLNFPEPDLTIYLDLPITEGLKRAKDRDKLDRFEKEDIDFFERIRNKYLELAKENSHRFFIIDSSKSQDEVFKKAVDCIEKKLNEN